jgi:hypothetical protein
MKFREILESVPVNLKSLFQRAVDKTDIDDDVYPETFKRLLKIHDPKYEIWYFSTVRYDEIGGFIVINKHNQNESYFVDAYSYDSTEACVYINWKKILCTQNALEHVQAIASEAFDGGVSGKDFLRSLHDDPDSLDHIPDDNKIEKYVNAIKAAERSIK